MLLPSLVVLLVSKVCAEVSLEFDKCNEECLMALWSNDHNYQGVHSLTNKGCRCAMIHDIHNLLNWSEDERFGALPNDTGLVGLYAPQAPIPLPGRRWYTVKYGIQTIGPQDVYFYVTENLNNPTVPIDHTIYLEKIRFSSPFPDTFEEKLNSSDYDYCKEYPYGNRFHIRVDDPEIPPNYHRKKKVEFQTEMTDSVAVNKLYHVTTHISDTHVDVAIDTLELRPGDRPRDIIPSIQCLTNITTGELDVKLHLKPTNRATVQDTKLVVTWSDYFNLLHPPRVWKSIIDPTRCSMPKKYTLTKNSFQFDIGILSNFRSFSTQFTLNSTDFRASLVDIEVHFLSSITGKTLKRTVCYIRESCNMAVHASKLAYNYFRGNAGKIQVYVGVYDEISKSLQVYLPEEFTLLGISPTDNEVYGITSGGAKVRLDGGNYIHISEQMWPDDLVLSTGYHMQGLQALPFHLDGTGYTRSLTMSSTGIYDAVTSNLVIKWPTLKANETFFE